jgi:hypothetical protein
VEQLTRNEQVSGSSPLVGSAKSVCISRIYLRPFYAAHCRACVLITIEPVEKVAARPITGPEPRQKRQNGSLNTKNRGQTRVPESFSTGSIIFDTGLECLIKATELLKIGLSRKSHHDFTRIHPGFIAVCSNRAIDGRSRRRLRRSGRWKPQHTLMRLGICRALLISMLGDSCQARHNFPIKSGHCSHDGGTSPPLA